jgi:hypothetical protein
MWPQSGLTNGDISQSGTSNNADMDQVRVQTLVKKLIK